MEEEVYMTFSRQASFEKLETSICIILLRLAGEIKRQSSPIEISSENGRVYFGLDQLVCEVLS